MYFINNLQAIPQGINELTSLIANLDQCFLSGLARLGDSHKQTLGTLGRVFSGTPLEETLDETLNAIQNNIFSERHFAVIGAARASLHGTSFDILRDHLLRALGRSSMVLPELPDIPESETPPEIIPLLESIRHWLTEIALTGFKRLEPETVTPFMSTLEKIQTEPRLVRQSALLTGFFYEMLNTFPASDGDAIPLRRWTDLWTRSMVASLYGPHPRAPAENVSGTVCVLGIDVREHPYFIGISAYGVLETDQALPRLERISLST